MASFFTASVGSKISSSLAGKFGTGLVPRLCAVLLSVLGASQVSAAPAAQAGAGKAARCLSECTPRIGIVSAFGAEADILLEQTRERKVWLINGNRYTTGILRGNPVVIVLSGVSMINATMNTQLMLDHFHIERLIMSGIAGGVNPANHVGDVMVPERWAMPMEVYWNGDATIPAPCGKEGDVSCLGLQLATEGGKPRAGFKLHGLDGKNNGSLFLRDNFLMHSGNAPQGEYRFDYEADARMLAIARSIKPKLLQCSEKDPKLCVSHQPQIKVGGRAVSGTAFLANADYREYLYETLKAEVVDMETAALAHVAHANRVPYIAFRSVSDLAGGHDFKEVGTFFGSGLAETNEAAVTLAFLEAWHQQTAKTKPKAGTKANSKKG
ncbi:MAG: nucleosidase [Pseudomonadota bacterium]